MAFVLGMNAKMYYGDALIAGTGEAAVEAVNWTEQTNVKDASINLETGTADITTRANSGWRATAATLKDGSMEFEMVYDTSDAGFAAIQAAFMASTEISLMHLDGDESTTGSEGLASNFTISNFSITANLEEAMTVSVTAKPSSYTQWYEQTGP